MKPEIKRFHSSIQRSKECVSAVMLSARPALKIFWKGFQKAKRAFVGLGTVNV